VAPAAAGRQKEEEVVAALHKQLAAAAVQSIMSPLNASFIAQLPQQLVKAIYATAVSEVECMRQHMDAAVRIYSMCVHGLVLQLQQP
jgi:hypothetical protein